ncbi:MAG TPA: hypothetical protein VL326_32510 [Kofleriaceae bacterium]|jgi:hypothetical protein|nr:hypothetical protein [Kofleriaceae bacterium]
MSYRNDHDAALARVDALEADNERLASENAKLRAGDTVELPTPARSRRRGPIVVASVAGIAVAVAVGVMATVAAPVHAPPIPTPLVPAAGDKPTEVFTKADLERCARGLVNTPADRDATSTDPRGTGHSVAPVLHSTGCRAEIRDVLDTATISAAERRTLATWADAEARLDATVAMVAEYYKTDPYKLDSYSTAPQLWTEYNRALVIRNDALESWRIASR